VASLPSPVWGSEVLKFFLEILHANLHILVLFSIVWGQTDSCPSFFLSAGIDVSVSFCVVPLTEKIANCGILIRATV